MHDLDKLTYKIIDGLENYKEYYKNYLEVNKANPNRIKNISEFISYKVLELKKTDYNKYEKYILEFIKVYYKWKNFIKKHDGEHLLNSWDIKYLEGIEHIPLDQLLDEIGSSFQFLFTLVSEYMHYTTEKLEIKEEIIDNYFYKESSNELKEKLKCK